MAMKMAMLFMLALVFVHGVRGQGCNTNNYGVLASCLSATRSNGALNQGSGCCQTIYGFRGNPDCLCQTMLAASNALRGTNNPALQFDVGRALTIPARCGYQNQIPRGYRCGGYTVGGK